MASFQLLDEASESMVAIALPPANARVGGNLQFAPKGGISLELFDTARDPGAIFTGSSQHYPVILGQLHDGPAFTLLDCFPANTHFGGGGFAQVSLVANQMLTGIHLRDPAQAVFDEIRVSMSSLNDWMGLRPIQQQMSELPVPGTGRQATISCRHYEMAGFSPLNGGPSLLTDQEFSTSFDWVESASIRNQFYLRLIPRNPFSLDACVQEVFRLQAFTSLLCGHQVFFREIRLYQAGLQGRDRQMNVVRYLAEFGRAKEHRRSRRHDILLPLPNVWELLPEIWIQWIERYEQYRSAVELYTSTEVFVGQLLHFQLLAIIQALETLHRNRFGGNYLTATDYAAALTSFTPSIAAITDADLRSALKARLKYGNEYSLRKRLKELSKLLPMGVLALIHPKPVPFLEQAVDTRNYLTHFDASLKGIAFDGDELYWATRLLRWFFVAIILTDLGIPEGILVNALKQSEELAHARSVVTKTPRGPAIIVETAAKPSQEKPVTSTPPASPEPP